MATPTLPGRATGTAATKAAEFDELQRASERWRLFPVRDDRIDVHLLGLIARAGLTGGRVLEIGGRERPRKRLFPGDRWTYANLDLEAGPDTVVADITGCPELPDNSFDLIVSVDVFEHLNRPWLAAAEISRLLRPGGLAYTSTLFAWRYHPCPIDFWRFTPEALGFLFAELDVLDQGWDLVERRRDMRKKAKADPMPLDEFGGWRENVRVYHAGVRPVTAHA